jgi:hypothetical protein
LLGDDSCSDFKREKTGGERKMKGRREKRKRGVGRERGNERNNKENR